MANPVDEKYGGVRTRKYTLDDIFGERMREKAEDVKPESLFCVIFNGKVITKHVADLQEKTDRTIHLELVDESGFFFDAFSALGSSKPQELQVADTSNEKCFPVLIHKVEHKKYVRPETTLIVFKSLRGNGR